jgi:predicted dehydrogenase
VSSPSFAQTRDTSYTSRNSGDPEGAGNEEDLMKKLNVAIIGCGTIGSGAHLPGYQAASDIAEVAYFVDIIRERAETLRDRYGKGKVLTDYRELLGDRSLDSVSVCTPNSTHAPITIDLLRAGKHVLCEKPAAVNAVAAGEMQRAAEESGRMLAIGVVNRFNTAVNKVRELIEAGELGTVYHVNCSFRAHRSIPGLGGAFTTKAQSGGGVLIDWGVHYLDLIFYCIGQPEVRTVSAAAYSILGRDMQKYVFEKMWAGPPDYAGAYDVDDYVTGLVRTAGPTINVNGAWAQNIGESAAFIEFLGDRGGIKLAYGGNFKLYTTKNGMLTETSFTFPTTNMFNDEIRDFLITASKGEKSRANIDNAILTSRLMDMIYASAERGTEVTAD